MVYTFENTVTHVVIAPTAQYTLGEVTPGTITWEVNGLKNTPEGTYKVSTVGDVTLIATPTKTTDGSRRSPTQAPARSASAVLPAA